ncbi:hypothetical protein EJ02DRAFT_459276 [Clathrospora elynae]|uniref:DUF7730 domain-containing protein n=1 Tax=Clathrospora elynae TaxID=706981 RepID=A0A6A5SE30_9PLEO|nr:hypothetical protein EJ02DRAFT_459276 [Clathrospora elynae]
MGPARRFVRTTSTLSLEIVRHTRRRLKETSQYLARMMLNKGSRQQITTKNQRQSPLLRLPPELRNMIYEYVLSGLTFQMHHIKVRQDRRALAIVSVCRQTHADTCVLLYKLGTFSFDRLSLHPDTKLPCLKHFLARRTLVQREAIQTISLLAAQPVGSSSETSLEPGVGLAAQNFDILKSLPNLKRVNMFILFELTIDAFRYHFLPTVTERQFLDWVMRKLNPTRDALHSLVHLMVPAAEVGFFWLGVRNELAVPLWDIWI